MAIEPYTLSGNVTNEKTEPNGVSGNIHAKVTNKKVERNNAKLGEL